MLCFFFFFWGGGGLVWGRGLVGGQDGSERRIEVFVKIQKKKKKKKLGEGGGRVGGVRLGGGVKVDVNREKKFL